MRNLLSGCLVVLATLGVVGCSTTTPKATVAKPEVKSACSPRDLRDQYGPDAFISIADNEWVTPERPSTLPFDELIFSWAVKLPEKEGFRLYLRVRYSEPDASGETHSPWLYGGFWGEVTDKVKGRKVPTFAHGSVEMDQLLMDRTASHYQFKLVSSGSKPLATIPAMNVITTNNHPDEKLCQEFATVHTMIAYLPMALDLPLRAQCDSKGNPTPDRCQSAALATALQYFGKAFPLEDIIALTNDPEYNYPGIWPRTVGAANQLGYHGYIDRFRDWQSVKATLAQNKVILCSIKMPKDGEYVAPPYPSIGGHIVALNGFTPEGNLVVTDSYPAKDGTGYRLQWKPEDFEKIWMGTKGGVGMVIEPLQPQEPKLAKDLPAFPKAEREALKAKWAKEAAEAKKTE